MTKRTSVLAMILAFGALTACSESDPDDDSNNNGASGGEGGSGGTADGASGSETGGTSGEAGIAGSGGSGGSDGGESAGGSDTGGAGGTGGADVGGAGGEGGAGGATAYEGPFTCTEYIGAYLSMEWWTQGFEDKLDALGVPGATSAEWQIKWHHHGHIPNWGDPNSPFWPDFGNPNDDNQGSPIDSACAVNSTAPDRIVFLAIDWDMLSKEEWVAALNQAVDTIQLKRPSAKRIDLMPLVRCPSNMQCNPNQDYGPGAGLVAGRQDCQIKPYADEAMAEVVATRSDIVGMGPVLEALACREPPDGAHFYGEENQRTAQSIAEFYAARP